MPSKSIVTKIAAITLALTAVASPLAANAASGPLADQYAAGQSAPPSVSSATVSIVPASRLADPLELAKQYAPDTVPGWEKTLAAFDSVTKRAAVLTISDADTGPKSDVNRTIAATKLSPSGTKFDFASLKDIQIHQAKAMKVGAVPTDELEALTIDASKTVPQNLKTAAKAADIGAAASLGAVTLATEASVQTSPLFQAHIDLNKAAHSKDSDAIKESLAKLLKLYQAEIKKLENAK